MSYSGVLKINIPTMDEGTIAFKYVWQSTLVFRDTSFRDEPADDVYITIESEEFEKTREQKHYVKSTDIFNYEEEGRDLRWLYYDINNAKSIYYNNVNTLMAAISAYLDATYMGSNYSFLKFSTAKLKFRTYAANDVPLRAWSIFNDVTEKFKRVSLFDNLVAHDEDDPFVSSNMYFYSSTHPSKTYNYITGKEANNFPDSDFNDGGENKLDGIFIKLDDMTLLYSEQCIPVIKFYDVDNGSYDDDGLSEDLKIENISVTDEGSDITSYVMEEESSFSFSDENPNCIELDKIYYYDDAFGNLTFQYDVVFLNKRILTSTSTITKV